MRRLPHIFQNGLDNPTNEEIQFHTTPDLVSEWALSSLEDDPDDPLAFIEVDFPDDDIDEWFTYCIATTSDEADNARYALEDDIASGRITEDQIEAAQEYIQSLESMETGLQSFEVLGYACLFHVVPPEMIKLLDPVTMMEAVYTGDVGAVAEAVETAEVQSFETLGSSFWVWLIFFMSQWFGPKWGTAVEEKEAAEKGEARKRRRKARRKAKGKKRKRKARATT